MTNPTTAKVETIKVKEISLSEITKNSMTSEKGARAAGIVWAQTVLWYNSVVEKLDTIDTEQDVKDIAEALRENFKNTFLTKYEGDLTGRGRNARTGKMMDICNGSGEVKWSSWEETRLPISYMGDIAKIVKGGVVGDLLVGDKEVMAKGAALKLAKKPESAMATVTRSLELIEKKVDDLTEAEIVTLKGLLDTLKGKL